MIKSIHSCALFVCFGKFNDFFVLILFGVERKTESKLASNTDTKVSALDYLSICFLCVTFAIAPRENTTEESAP